MIRSLLETSAPALKQSLKRYPVLFRLAKSWKSRLDDDDKTVDVTTGEISPADVGYPIRQLDKLKLFGDAWLDPRPTAPILVIKNVPKPLRGLISQFFPDRRVAFKGTKFQPLLPFLIYCRLKNQKIEVVSANQKVAFSDALFKGVRSLDDDVMALTVEDELEKYPLALSIGRSAGSDTNQKGLQADLREIESVPAEDLARLRAQLDAMVSEGITFLPRYGNTVDPVAFGPRVRQRVLVVGVNSSRAARARNGEGDWQDERLIELALDENEGADFVFFSDDMARQTRAKLSKRILKKIAVIEDGVSAASILQQVDKVYVGSSILGFDALIRGIPVRCVGRPFYAGWGLTNDKQSFSSRKARPTIDKLAYAYLYRHLRYLADPKDPVSGFGLTIMRASNFRQGIYSPRDWPASVPFTEATAAENLAAELTTPNDRVEALGGSKFGRLIRNSSVNAQCIKDLGASLSPVPMFRSLNPIANYLATNVRFDELRDVVTGFRDWFETLDPANLNHLEARKFLGDLAGVLKIMAGRHVARMPNYPGLDQLPYDTFKLTLLPYVRLLALNIEYERAEEILKSRPIDDPNLLLKLSGTFNERPYRSERNGVARNRLGRQLAVQALESLDQKYDGWINQVINRMWVAKGLNNHAEVCALSDRLVDGLGRNGQPTTTEQKRLSQLHSVIRYLISVNKADTAKRLFDATGPYLGAGNAERAAIRLAIFAGEKDAAIQKIEAMSGGRTARGGTALRWTQGFRSAALNLQNRFKVFASRSYRPRDIEVFKRLVFLNQASEIVNALPQPVMPRGVVFVASLGCLNTIAMIAPMLNELKRKGYAVLHLSEGIIENQPVNEATYFHAANDIAGKIPAGNTDHSLQLEWTIDWDSRIVESNGINFYQGIYERLSTHFRRFHVDLRDPEVGRWFNSYLKAMDLLLRVCLRIDRELVRQGVPVVLVGSNSHVAPYSVFRDFCLARNRPNLRFAAVNVAYENYYTNLGSKFSGSMAIVDMTLHRTCRAPFLAITERFDKWYAENKDNPIIQEKVKVLLRANRNQGEQATVSPTAERLSRERAAGKRVICCFGKILCDLAVPYDGGPGHADIVDWLRHTVETVRGRDDVILLIKPHPHELRPEIALDLTEYLTDVLPADLPDNVIVLGHREFNVHEIIKWIDLAVLWNGTSSLEITALGLPVMMCSDFGRHDYPLELIYPESRDQYAEYLLTGEFKEPDDELRRRAMALLHYMGTSEVALPNRYSRRSSTNDSVGVPAWNEAEVDRFLRQGDPAVTLAAERAVEGLEKLQ